MWVCGLSRLRAVVNALYTDGSIVAAMGRRRGGLIARLRRTAPAEPLPLPAADPEPPRLPEGAPAVAERVREIVEAAERNAVEIERFAQAEAERIRAKALAEGERHLAALRERTRAVEERTRLLEHSIARLTAAAGEEARTLGIDLGAGGAPALPAPAASPQLPPASSIGEGRSETASAIDGARLVALDIALAGGSRAEAADALAEHFPDTDAAAVLDNAFREAGR